MKALLSLFVLSVLLFSFVQAQERRSSCCCAEGWVLAAPLDHTIQCLFQHDYFSFQGDVEFTGYAAELDACAADFCGVCGGYCDGDQVFTPTPNHSDRYELVPVDIDVNTGCGNTRTITKTWSESCGGTPFTVNQVVTIVDTIPVEVVVPLAQSQECFSTNGIGGSDVPISEFDNYFGSARATDLCTNPQWTTYTASLDGGSTACVTSYTRTFTASDGCNTATTRTQSVSFVDTTPPVIEVEAFITTTCTSPELTTPTAPVARDACENVVATPAIASTTTYPGKCAGDYSIERIWSVADTCNNVGYASQIIVVEDLTPPTIVPAAESFVQDVFCNFLPAAQTYTVTDDCGSAYLSMEETISGNTEQSERYDVIRTFKASDDCGNYVTWEHVFVVDSGSITTLELTSPVDNPLLETKGDPIPLSFEFSGIVCSTAYIVIDIGAADFVSITLPDCTDSNGGPIYCPIQPPGGLNVDFDLTIVVPTTYHPDTLQIRFGIAQTDPTVDINLVDPHFLVLKLADP